MRTTTQELNERTVKIIYHAIIECGRHRFCKAAGISESLYYKRRDRPEMLRLGEIRTLYRLGKLTDDQILSMVREERRKP